MGMNIKIREAVPADFERLEEILAENGMLDSPNIDGKKAMQRIYECMGKYFLVAETSGFVIGMVRGCYDGSRNIMHQIAVDKKYQRHGIGKSMVHELALRFKSDGATSLAVTSTTEAKKYYEMLSFSDLPITLMVAFDINEVIRKTEAHQLQ